MNASRKLLRLIPFVITGISLTVAAIAPAAPAESRNPTLDCNFRCVYCFDPRASGLPFSRAAV